VRRKWVAATPEETVRQRLLAWLLSEAALPPSRLAVERAIAYGALRKRFDVVGFDTSGAPRLLCECKAPSVPVSSHTWAQTLTYNAVMQAPVLLLTNGETTLWAHAGPDGWQLGTEAHLLIAALRA
jgi:hypothetical protein